MKRSLVCFLVVTCLGFSALADSQQMTVVVTNTETEISSAIPVSGWLDKIEIQVSGSSTSAVTVATYASDGTTAIDTLLTLTAATANTVVRPRVIGTTTAGVALASASAIGGTNEYAKTVLVAPYERIMVGGDIRLKVVSGSAAANTVKATVYYEPTRK
jgi:hypothetical protein